MVTITPRALSVIRGVTAHPLLGAASGLQIAARPGGTDADAPLGVAAVAEPAAGAEEVLVEGGRVYLGPGVAQRLEAHELDVRTDAQGRQQFLLREAA